MRSQERIAKRLGAPQQTISGHLPKMATLPNPVNADLSRGFTVSQVAEKHNWTEPMVWSLALEGKEDLKRFKELGWGLRTWDLWNWNDCLPREIHVSDSEGYGRHTPADRKKFYLYSRGSLEETKSWLRKLIRRKVLSESNATEYKAIVEKLGPKLNAFINSTKA